MRRKRIDSFGPMIEWTLLGLTRHVTLLRSPLYVPSGSDLDSPTGAIKFMPTLFNLYVIRLLLESKFHLIHEPKYHTVDLMSLGYVTKC
jgi:hypothetical protein